MDGLDIFYIAFAAAWTVAIVAGAAVLVRNRAEHCVRIRNLPLALSAVACLHVFWMLALLVRPIRDRYSCATEYWIMSVYLPLGVALFQATSMQLLSVAGLQSAILLVDQHHSPRKLPARLVPRLLFRWRSMTLLKRTELGIAIGMVLQVGLLYHPFYDYAFNLSPPLFSHFCFFLCLPPCYFLPSFPVSALFVGLIFFIFLSLPFSVSCLNFVN